MKVCGMVDASVNYWRATASRVQQTPPKQPALPSETVAKTGAPVQPAQLGRVGGMAPQNPAAIPQEQPRHTKNPYNAGSAGGDKALLMLQASPNLTFQQMKAILQSDVPPAPNRTVNSGAASPAGPGVQPAPESSQRMPAFFKDLGINTLG